MTAAFEIALKLLYTRLIKSDNKISGAFSGENLQARSRRRVKSGLRLQAEECLYVTGINLCHCSEMGQVAFLLLGLFRENVALESMFSLDLS